MTTDEHFHDTPKEIYDRLVSLFGEQDGSKVNAPDTRWVVFGAGSVRLTFFAPRVTAEQADEPESVVRDPEAWQAVAAEGRRFA